MSFNWEFILSFTLAFGLVFVIFMTLGFYISYKRDQRLKKNAVPEDPIEGRYFTRFLPDELRNKYESDDWREKLEVERQLQKRINRAIVFVPFALFLAIGGYFVVAHRDLLFAPVSLSEEEISGLRGKQYHWAGELSPSVPRYEDIIGELKGFSISLVFDESDLDWKPDGHIKNPTMEQKTGWTAWAEGLGLKATDCSWAQLRVNCGKNVGTTLFVVLAGKWQEDGLNSLLNRGGRILLVGAPRQLFGQPLGFFQWKGLKFSRADRGRQDLLALSGDKVLTLGWDGGTIIDVPPIMRGYQVESSDGQGLRITALGETRGQMNVGLAGRAEVKGRWTWLDYHPLRSGGGETQSRLVEGLTSSVFRFLIGKPYGNIAGWPRGAQFGVAATFSMAESTKEAKKFVDGWTRKIPLSLFLTAGVLETERDWIRKGLMAQDINCQGSPTESLDGQGLLVFSQALLLCRKIAEEVVGVTAKGYRPYGDLITQDTMSAAQLAGFDFVLTGPHWQTTPDVQIDAPTGARLIRIGRVSRDAHAFFGKEQMSLSDIKQTAQSELNWAESLGGVHVLSLQDRYVSQTDHGEFVRFIEQWIGDRKDQVFAGKASQISRWWRVRGHLLRGIKITDEERKEFQPFWVQVDTSGQIHSEPWTPARTISSVESGESQK